MNTDEQARFDAFVDLIHQAQEREHLAALLRALLTPAELREIPNRLKITQMLRDGLTQRDIAKKLGVGIATVTRGSKTMSEIEQLLDKK